MKNTLLILCFIMIGISKNQAQNFQVNMSYTSTTPTTGSLKFDMVAGASGVNVDPGFTTYGFAVSLPTSPSITWGTQTNINGITFTISAGSPDPNNAANTIYQFDWFGLAFGVSMYAPNSVTTVLQIATSFDAPSSGTACAVHFNDFSFYQTITGNSGTELLNTTDPFPGGSGDGSNGNPYKSNPTALPVDLVHFTGQLTEDQYVHLRWSTASEVNNDYFHIERSANGKDFEVIGTVVGYGNSETLQEYDTWDRQPFFGYNYYRLKQVDFDGRFTYSSIITVMLEKEEINFLLYPNPTSDFLNVKFESNAQKGNIQIFNNAGKLVLQEQLSENAHQQQLDLRELPKGIYFVNIFRNDKNYHHKVLLQ